MRHFKTPLHSRKVTSDGYGPPEDVVRCDEILTFLVEFGDKVSDRHDGGSKKFIDGTFDLEKYLSEKIQFRYRYQTDRGTHGTNVFVNDIALKAAEMVGQFHR